MKLITDSISVAELQEMSKKMFGGLVKAVVDIEKDTMIVDAELHADQEEFLLDQGSLQENLWGINIYPAKAKHDGWIEFDSMINVRPAWGNSTRSVEDPVIQKKIIDLVNTLVSQ